MASLHLGFRLDPKTGKPGPDRLVVESGDLTTHGVIVGMTGSGKTGLGVVLIEEALLAGIPVLVLDPKGDMGNLLLTFPDLDAASFRPWVNEDDARSEGRLARRLRAAHGHDLARGARGERHRARPRPRAPRGRRAHRVHARVGGRDPAQRGRLAEAPELPWDTEAETLREEIEGTVTSLLGLVGIAGGPALEP